MHSVVWFVNRRKQPAASAWSKPGHPQGRVRLPHTGSTGRLATIVVNISALYTARLVGQTEAGLVENAQQSGRQHLSLHA
jgi:hypothetical protein